LAVAPSPIATLFAALADAPFPSATAELPFATL